MKTCKFSRHSILAVSENLRIVTRIIRNEFHRIESVTCRVTEPLKTAFFVAYSAHEKPPE